MRPAVPAQAETFVLTLPMAAKQEGLALLVFAFRIAEGPASALAVGLLVVALVTAACWATLPVALKFFSPERFADEREYREVMERMAHISSRVGLLAFAATDSATRRRTC